MIGFTPEPAIRRRMALTWGVQSTLVEHVAHTDRMFIQVDDYLLAQRPREGRRQGRRDLGIPSRNHRLDQRHPHPQGRRRRPRQGADLQVRRVVSRNPASRTVALARLSATVLFSNSGVPRMDFFWWLLWLFYIAAYIYVVILIITDLFRDEKANGWLKAVWIIALVFVPFLTALVYVIANGKGMAERAAASRGLRTVAGVRRLPARRVLHPDRRHREGEGAAGRRRHQPGRVRRAQEQGARKPVLRRVAAAMRRADASTRRHPLSLLRTGGGTRTHTPFRATDFESVASAIPPHRPGTSANDHTVGFKGD